MELNSSPDETLQLISFTNDRKYMMTLETRPPAPMDIIRMPYDQSFSRGGEPPVMQDSFPPTMLQDGIHQLSPGFLGLSTTTWVLILAGAGVIGTLAYLEYKRKKESKVVIEISPKK